MTDRGAGTFGTAAGLLVFLLLMFSAVQILFNLHATSMVTAAAHDAATEVAGFRSSTDRCGAIPRAEELFRTRLGEYGAGGHADLHWTCGGTETVRVRVVARHPSVLPHRLRGLLGLGELDRTIEIRAETPR
jgi:hypothetical protein